MGAGTVVAPSHEHGGKDFIVADTGKPVNIEGKEIIIPEEVVNDTKSYNLSGTNREVIGQILSKFGLSVNDNVTSVKSGDVVICKVSATDTKKRSFSGTVSQILSTINQSGGCNPIGSSEAEVKASGGTINGQEIKRFVVQNNSGLFSVWDNVFEEQIGSITHGEDGREHMQYSADRANEDFENGLTDSMDIARIRGGNYWSGRTKEEVTERLNRFKTFNAPVIKREEPVLMKQHGGKINDRETYAIKSKLRTLSKIISNKETFSVPSDGLSEEQERFVSTLVEHSKQNIQYNNPKLEKLANSFGITNRRQIKELAELSIVMLSREIALGEGTVQEKYNKIVNSYHTQVNLSFRTSDTLKLQQYSTAAPIAYLMGEYVNHLKDSSVKSLFKSGDKVSFISTGQKIKTEVLDIPSNKNDAGFQIWVTTKGGGYIDESRLVPAVVSAKKQSLGQGYKSFKDIGAGAQEYRIEFADGDHYTLSTARYSDKDDAIREAIRRKLNNRPSTVEKIFFEPSAGNGLLTIAIPPKQFIVNEIDEIRLMDLLAQGFQKVMSQDGSQPFVEYKKYFDGVITNPPFGSLTEPVYYDTYGINSLEHLMALRALDTMKDNGRAAIIIGGHTSWDSEGRIQSGKNRIFFSYLYSNYFVADVINIDSQKLYSRMGTSFDIRVILVGGRKGTPGGFPPLKDESLSASMPNSPHTVSDFETLYTRITSLLLN